MTNNTLFILYFSHQPLILWTSGCNEENLPLDPLFLLEQLLLCLSRMLPSVDKTLSRLQSQLSSWFHPLGAALASVCVSLAEETDWVHHQPITPSLMLSQCWQWGEERGEKGPPCLRVWSLVTSSLVLAVCTTAQGTLLSRSLGENRIGALQ